MKIIDKILYKIFSIVLWLPGKIWKKHEIEIMRDWDILGEIEKKIHEEFEIRSE